VLQGFSKNLFAAFDYRILPFLFVWLWLGLVFCEPAFLLLSIIIAPTWEGPSGGLAVAAIVVSLLLWAVIYRRCGFPLYLALLYPVTIIVAVAIAFRSLFQTVTGRARWKGRRLTAPPLRWL
jgi:chlorobactene glucosyltransferase